MVWQDLVCRRESFVNLRIWWDNAKAQIAVFCQQLQMFTSKQRRVKKNVLEREGTNLQGHLAKQLDVQKHKLFVEKQSLLQKIVNYKAMGAMIRLRMDRLYKIDAPIKCFFFNLEKESVPQKRMGCLRQPGKNGVSQSQIKRVISDHFKLFSNEDAQECAMEHFTTELPQLRGEHQADLGAG